MNLIPSTGPDSAGLFRLRAFHTAFPPMFMARAAALTLGKCHALPSFRITVTGLA